MSIQDDKLEGFIQNILSDAEQEAKKILQEINEEKESSLSAAEDETLNETYRLIKREVARIKTEHGRVLSKKVLENRSAIYARRQEIEQSILQEITRRLDEYTRTQEYVRQLSEQLEQALSRFSGEPSVIYLRAQDMLLAPELQKKAGRGDVEFRQMQSISLGGLIAVCPAKMLRVDQSFDGALEDLKGHIAELIGLDLAEGID